LHRWNGGCERNKGASRYHQRAVVALAARSSALENSRAAIGVASVGLLLAADFLLGRDDPDDANAELSPNEP